MKALVDRDGVLSRGLADIRRQFEIPADYPAAAVAEAEAAASRPLSDHADWTCREFVTLDPQSSTDLDQAFSIERQGADLILYYAIADVAWFVRSGGDIDAEAWKRGETIYMPDGKASLYPARL